MSENETTKSTKFTKENQGEDPSIPPFVVFVSLVVKDLGLMADPSGPGGLNLTGWKRAQGRELPKLGPIRTHHASKVRLASALRQSFQLQTRSK